MRIAAAAALVVVMGGAAACGSPKTLADILGPSSNATVTALAINVNPPAIGGTVVATATATFDNGTTSLVPAVFSSDTPAVATIASTTGVATGASIGDVTFAADFHGFHATKKVRVLPAYGATFAGTYRVDACADSGDFNDPGTFCRFYPAGTTLQIAFQWSQSDDLKSVTGLFAIGQVLFSQVVGDGTGTVSPSGELAFTGSATVDTVSVNLRNFIVTSSSAGHIGGHFEEVWTSTASSGQGVLTCTLQAASRVSGQSVQQLIAARR